MSGIFRGPGGGSGGASPAQVSVIAAAVARAEQAAEDAQASAALAASITDTDIKAWALAQSFAVISATRNSDGAITTASIVWPDGASGVYTADTFSTAFPGATDAWHATYLGSVTRTLTQPAVTRNSDGVVTAQPAITIA